MLTRWLLAITAWILAACDPAAGDACAGAAARCVDPTTFMQCIDGVQTARHCRGAGGCAVSGRRVTCDESVAAEGDACTGEGVACSTDRTAELTCTSGVFARSHVCRGPGGCLVEEGHVACDLTVARVGDPCTSGATCSEDHAQKLHCVDGAFALESACPGDGHCLVAEGLVTCDGGVPVDEDERAWSAFACDTHLASAPCLAIAAYANAHVPAAPTQSLVYLGIRHQPGHEDHHEYERIVLAPDPAGARVSETYGLPSATLDQAWPALEAALAHEPVTSDDPEVARLFAEARRSPARVSPDSDHLIADAAHDRAVVQGFGTTLLREAGGHLYAITANGWVTDLVPLGAVEIDGDPTVNCQSQSFVGGLTFSGCEDGHTYGAACTEAGACTCVRDGVEGEAFVHEGDGFLSGGEVRAHCHYPIR